MSKVIEEIKRQNIEKFTVSNSGKDFIPTEKEIAESTVTVEVRNPQEGIYLVAVTKNNEIVGMQHRLYDEDDYCERVVDIDSVNFDKAYRQFKTLKV